MAADSAIRLMPASAVVPSPSVLISHPLCRRQLLGGAVASGLSLTGCLAEPSTPLRIGAHAWPGYEFLYLARQQAWLDSRHARLIEVPSASASLRALASRALEGATLTLDEVLTARARGIKLTVVAVLDESNGADVVLGQPGMRSATELKGKRVGVEHGAVGALMLEALCLHHGMTVREMHVIPMSIEEHHEAFMSARVDAVVTYEPVRSHLVQAGAVPLFSSAQIPGRIIDTLAIRSDWLAEHVPAVRHLVAAHFQALAQWLRQPEVCAPLMAPRLNLSAAQVVASYAQIKLPSVRANQSWLAPQLGRIDEVAHQLLDVMLSVGLLAAPPDLDQLASAAFLPFHPPA
jgi:NitT/TauT family transport system substrate-binding protein